MEVNFSQEFLLGWLIVNMFTLTVLAVIGAKWVMDIGLDFIEWVTGEWFEWL